MKPDIPGAAPRLARQDTGPDIPGPIHGTRIGQSVATPRVVLHGLEPPIAVATRPQDWAEPARSIIFSEAEIAAARSRGKIRA